MNEVVSFTAKCAPTGAFMGSLSDHSAVALGSYVISALFEDSTVKVGEISQIIIGQVLTAGCG